MLRAAMALFSTLQIGARIKESVERSLRQAAVIAVALSMGRPPKKAPAPSPLVATPDPTAKLDQGVGKAMQQVGPVPLLAVAFIAGVLFGRR